MMDLWGGVQVVVLINFFVKIWKKDYRKFYMLLVNSFHINSNFNYI